MPRTTICTRCHKGRLRAVYYRKADKSTGKRKWVAMGLACGVCRCLIWMDGTVAEI